MRTFCFEFGLFVLFDFMFVVAMLCLWLLVVLVCLWWILAAVVLSCLFGSLVYDCCSGSANCVVLSPAGCWVLVVDDC